MFWKSKPTDIPSAAEALEGRATEMAVAERHFVNGQPLKGPHPDGCEIIHFGLGCFWGAERLFWQATWAAVSRDMYQEAFAARGLGRITTEIGPAGPFYYAETYHQQYLAKNPMGYCGLKGSGVSCPLPAPAAAN